MPAGARIGSGSLPEHERFQRTRFPIVGRVGLKGSGRNGRGIGVDSPQGADGRAGIASRAEAFGSSACAGRDPSDKTSRHESVLPALRAGEHVSDGFGLPAYTVPSDREHGYSGVASIACHRFLSRGGARDGVSCACLHHSVPIDARNTYPAGNSYFPDYVSVILGSIACAHACACARLDRKSVV